MFQDEAGFGRINKPKYCWCEKGIRPSVPCHHIREYRYTYGAVEPLTGDGYFLVMPYYNTACMNIFLKGLSEQYPEDVILLCCDGAAWHRSRALEIPENIILFQLPAYTPEMNPIEQIWKEIRKRGFRNEIFATLEKVVDRLWVPSRVMRKIVCRLWLNEVSQQQRRLQQLPLNAPYSYTSYCPTGFRPHGGAWRRPASAQNFHPGKFQPHGYGGGSPGSVAQ